jgi:PPOX class probable F420-dependent enzyme
MNVASTTPFALPRHVREFLAETHFASIATTDPDGAPRQAVVWFLPDGDDIIVNSRVGRRWPTNLLRDDRTYVAVFDERDPLRWVGLRGTVEPIRDQVRAQADIAAMARRYEADPATAERKIRDFERMERISFRVRIVAVHDHLD